MSPTYSVDVLVLAHGSPGFVSGGLGCVADQDIRDFSTVPGLHLRAVYQQNCFGSSLNDAWLAAGAKAVNGSNLLNHMPLAYSSFLARWISGQSFNQAVQGSTNDWTPFFSTVYHFADLFVENGDTRTARVPTQFDLFGGLSSAEEMSDSAMIVQGTSTGTTI